MDERWKRPCQLLPSTMVFLRDKSEGMECMMNTFAYSTFRMAGSKKTAGRDLLHNLFLDYPSVFTEQLVSFFRYNNISKLIFFSSLFFYE